MNAFTSFADLYDIFMDNIPYEEWAAVLDALIRENYVPDAGCGTFRPEELQVVDLGCGTGVMTRLLASRGYQMTGVDLSEDMLRIAWEKSLDDAADAAGWTEQDDAVDDISQSDLERAEAAAGGSNRASLSELETAEDAADDAEGQSELPRSPLYICQDMRELDLGEAVDVIVSVADCVNYLLTGEDMAQMFAAVYRQLVTGGLFVFDFNTLHKYRDVIGEATIAESRVNCAFIWENWFDENTRINEYNVTLFVAEPDNDEADLSEGGGVFRRSAETHYQRGYTEEEMLQFAADAGFSVLRILDGEDHGPARKDSERVRIVLRRQ